MTIRRKHRSTDVTPATEAPADAAMAAAIERAIAARDFERAALLMLVGAVDALKGGTIDDLINVLAGEEAGDDAGA
jgi:hypothetical protein